jgi:hypothetical protein
MSHALKNTPKGEIQTKLPYLAVLRTSEHWYVIVILLLADRREVKSRSDLFIRHAGENNTAPQHDLGCWSLIILTHKPIMNKTKKKLSGQAQASGS